jgi:transposase-like protein
VEEGLSASEASQRLSLPQSTLKNWVRAAKAGKLGAIGKDRRPLAEVALELAKLKKELAMVRMERDILKKAVLNSTCQGVAARYALMEAM